VTVEGAASPWNEFFFVAVLQCRGSRADQRNTNHRLWVAKLSVLAVLGRIILWLTPWSVVSTPLTSQFWKIISSNPVWSSRTNPVDGQSESIILLTSSIRSFRGNMHFLSFICGLANVLLDIEVELWWQRELPNHPERIEARK
jgi:hypothetical protein